MRESARERRRLGEKLRELRQKQEANGPGTGHGAYSSLILLVEGQIANLSRLDDDQRVLLERRIAGETLENIGKTVGTSRERIRQRETSALRLVYGWAERGGLHRDDLRFVAYARLKRDRFNTGLHDAAQS